MFVVGDRLFVVANNDQTTRLTAAYFFGFLVLPGKYTMLIKKSNSRIYKPNRPRIITFKHGITYHSRSHLGWYFRMLFQSSKLKAHSSNVSFHWNVAKETLELWALSFRKCHPKWDWCTARSVEDETRNDRRNENRNPEWWGYFSQLQTNITIWICTGTYRGIQIQSKSRFKFVPRHTGEFEFFDFD